MERNTFVKSHALGNDYIVLDPAYLLFPLTEHAIRLICDRHHGVGSDGILAKVPSAKATFGVRIYNPDGSEAEKSGNGLRIFARYLFDHGFLTTPEFTVETPGGIAKVTMHVLDGSVERITVEMGTATFLSDRIPMSGPSREVVNEQVDVDGTPLRVTAVSIGNPHCVVFVPRLEEVELQRLGPLLERHSMFPNHTNVQFAEVKSPTRVAILIWERGAGHTLASGSSACAVAAAAVKTGVAGRDLTIAMQGGDLRVSVGSDWSITMSGPAEEVYVGSFSDSFIQRFDSAP